MRPGTGSAKSGEELAESSCRSVAGSRRDVAVAVHAAVPDRDHEEGRAVAQHHRPGRDLGRARGDEAPSHLSDGSGGRVVTEGEPPHRAADSVRADHEVVLGGGAVAELDRDDSRPARCSPRTSAPVRIGTSRAPSSSTAWRSARWSARQGPTPSHSSARSTSTSSRPRSSLTRCRVITVPRSATACSRPSARSARTGVRGQVDARSPPRPRRAAARSTSAEKPARRERSSSRETGKAGPDDENSSDRHLR